jgi:hypothetical protein
MLTRARLFAIAAAFAASMIAGTARAALIPSEWLTTTTFVFTGTCTDCIGTVTATLELGNYTQGDPITAANFIEFTYDGSNLLPGFTILPADLTFIEGSIPAALPSAARVIVVGANPPVGFVSDTGGTWLVGLPEDDFGSNGIWAAAAVPEPASWALLGSSLLMLGLTWRRRRAAPSARQSTPR